MTTKRTKGQILVIILILLSILGIIAITATLTTVKDTKEQAQNKQYQQYYSLGERTIIDAQRFLSGKELKDITQDIILPNDSGYSLNGTCDLTKVDEGFVSCRFNNIPASQVISQESSETLSIYMEIRDTDYINNHTMEKDKDVLINIKPGSNNSTYIFWDDSTVAWGISYDYRTATEYLTDKVVFDTGSGPFNTNAQRTSTCLKVEPIAATSINSIIQKMGLTKTPKHIAKITNNNCGTAMYFRLRPYKSNNESITFSLYKDDVSGVGAMQRKISTITTSNLSNTTGQASEKPVSALETSFLLTDTPLSLFDYVLKTETKGIEFE